MNFNNRSVLSILLLALVFSFTTYTNSFAGGSGGALLPLEETDTNNYQLYSFYDLRDRESFVQVTSPDGASILHVQVFDVGNLCNENNFFDTFTPNDTHVYNLRELTTNDGNSAGFVLPDGAYGFVVITVVLGRGQPANTSGSIIGNFRVIDSTGYEYRTNSQGPSSIQQQDDRRSFTFNFNSLGGVNASDVVGITVNNINSGEVTASGSSLTFDTTLFNINEVEFSCSDTTFSCTADTFEYGINDAIPNSRDGGVTCGSNVITEGLVKLELNSLFRGTDAFAGYVGLNNSNGRGSMDSMHQERGLLSCEERGFCRVFVSSSDQDANFGGVAAADANCQGLADNAGLNGRFLAWISDSMGNSPDTNFNKVNVEYRLLNGNVVANSYADLIDCTNPDCLLVAIDLTEDFMTTSGLTWTGTNTDGTAFDTGDPTDDNCDNWTNNSSMVGARGLAGSIGQIDFEWTNRTQNGCGNDNVGFYCFEQ